MSLLGFWSQIRQSITIPRRRVKRSLRSARTLEERIVLTVSAYEQLFLELINRARANPTAEAARQGIALNEGLAAGTISTTAKQPLALNNALQVAIQNHLQFLIDTDQFTHTARAEQIHSRESRQRDTPGTSPLARIWHSRRLPAARTSSSLSSTSTTICLSMPGSPVAVTAST